MGRALEDFHIEGLGQNIPFLAAVMDQPRFRSGKLSTNYIKDEFPDGFLGLPPTRRAARPDERRRRCAMHRALLARAAPDQLRCDWIVIVGTPAAGDERRRGRWRPDDQGGRPRPAAGQTSTGGRASRCFRGKPRRARLHRRRSKPAAEGFVIRHRATTLHVLVLVAALGRTAREAAAQEGRRHLQDGAVAHAGAGGLHRRRRGPVGARPARSSPCSRP